MWDEPTNKARSAPDRTAQVDSPNQAKDHFDLLGCYWVYFGDVSSGYYLGLVNTSGMYHVDPKLGLSGSERVDPTLAREV
jgi:hypothetical protein